MEDGLLTSDFMVVEEGREWAVAGSGGGSGIYAPRGPSAVMNYITAG